MNLFSVFQQFPDQAACISHLEAVRWGEEPQCPFCESPRVARKAERELGGRWNCHACKSSFNVLSGPIFEKTRIPLQKWFLAISLMLNAKKSLSSYQLGCDLDVTQRSAWYLQQRIRAAMPQGDRYSPLYLPLYLAETGWKYNERKNPHAFGTFLRGVFR